MLTHPFRAVSVAAGVAALTLGSALPAAADAPEGWETQEVSLLGMVLVIAIIPVGLALVITLLSVVGGWRRGETYVPGQAWRSEAEWFGGPRKGVEAADEADPRLLESGETGGGSGRW